MKRIISLILALTILSCSFSLLASAGDLTTMCYVTLPDGGDKFTIEPLEGYDTLVRFGDSFAFSIKPIGDYSLKAATVAVNGSVIFNTDQINEYFPSHKGEQIYVIDAITVDIVITVENVMEESQANFFEWLIKLINMIVEFFAKLFGGTV